MAANNNAGRRVPAKTSLIGGMVDMKSIQNELPKAGAVVGGIVIGRFINGVLDKIIMSKTVAGFMGVEMQSNIAKFLKPTLVGLAGVGLMGYAKSQKSDLLYNVGLGVAGFGISGVFTALTAKNLIAGLGSTEDEFVMYDADGTRIGNIDMNELLPDLEAPVSGDGYEANIIMNGGDEFPMILNGDEDEFPSILNGDQDDFPMILN